MPIKHYWLQPELYTIYWLRRLLLCISIETSSVDVVVESASSSILLQSSSYSATVEVFACP
jgi:hypothetical protein